MKSRVGFCLVFLVGLAGCTRDLSAAVPVQSYPTYTPYPTYTLYPTYTPAASDLTVQMPDPHRAPQTISAVMNLIETTCDPQSRNWDADQAYTKFRGVVPQGWVESRWSVINTDEYSGTATCWYATYRPAEGEIDYMFYDQEQKPVLMRYSV